MHQYCDPLHPKISISHKKYFSFESRLKLLVKDIAGNMLDNSIQEVCDTLRHKIVLGFDCCLASLLKIFLLTSAHLSDINFLLS
jgi:hypothetical protein